MFYLVLPSLSAGNRGASEENSRFLTPFAEDANGFGMTRAGEAARGVEAAGPSPEAIKLGAWRTKRERNSRSLTRPIVLGAFGRTERERGARGFGAWRDAGRGGPTATFFPAELEAQSLDAQDDQFE